MEAVEEEQMSQAPDIDPMAIDPVEFARQVGQASDADLAAGLQNEEVRSLMLREIFGRMARHFRADQAGGIDAVVHWKIFDRPGGGYDHYELVVRDGTCTVNNPPEHEPKVTLKLGPVDFLKLVTGNAEGPLLFMSGKLRIEGDLLLSARLTGVFEIPKS
jgi:putative sterol carrier protein